MFKIVTKRVLNEAVVLMEIEAPFIAKKAQPGQFIIFRVDEHGERVPLTIADYDREKGTITIIFQIVGQTTMLLSQLKEGDALLDFVGPLGKATDFEGAKKVCVIGGGVGNAIAYPSAKQLFNEGVEVDVLHVVDFEPAQGGTVAEDVLLQLHEVVGETHFGQLLAMVEGPSV